ncbi:MAG TPA: hypothetical protein VE913_24815 [Longimicrobium sp.]|nr:hypothetical protein [Longimicrobium sp.]
MTRKLKLDPEELRVESFQPAPEPVAGRGTVVGQEAPPTLPLNQCFFSLFPTCGIYC